jgi:hypothetical protein
MFSLQLINQPAFTAIYSGRFGSVAAYTIAAAIVAAVSSRVMVMPTLLTAAVVLEHPQVDMMFPDMCIANALAFRQEMS